MISILVVIHLCFAHWIADFVFQTDWMAQNKSKSNKPLLVHIVTYSLILGIVLLPSSFFSFNLDLLYFIILNGVLHFLIDWNTSRITSRLHKQGKLGSSTVPNFGFFSIIGLDQFLHMVCLLLTTRFIFL